MSLFFLQLFSYHYYIYIFPLYYVRYMYMYETLNDFIIECHIIIFIN